jgi:hypothetical protein
LSLKKEESISDDGTAAPHLPPAPPPAEDEPKILKQPETGPISPEQLVAEVKGIYAGLVMVENKCIEVDNDRSSQTDPSNKKADAYFQNLQRSADNADSKGRARFFKLMRNIGAQLNKTTSALKIETAQFHATAILDLCMGPGGFSKAALDRNRNASLRGVSLPQFQCSTTYSYPIGRRILELRYTSATSQC